MKLTHWQYRILKMLSIMPFSKKADDALAGLSKHGRAKRPSPYADKLRKHRRKMARTSRQRQRPKYSKARRGRGRRNRYSSRSWR
jgi:hypothetical protein